MYTYRVDKDNMIYDEIEPKVDGTMIWIEIVDNDLLDRRFRKRFEETDADIEHGFHGTRHNLINVIAKEGFKMSYNKTSAHGKGTYFAGTSYTSKSYMKSRCSNNISYMFYCDILMTPSTKKVKTSSDDYYIVSNDLDCIPRYVIAFK